MTQAGRSRNRTQLSRALRFILAGVAVTYPVLYLVAARYRLFYPYELEWMEGAVVDHVRRVLSSEPLYVEPSLEFVPFIYTPLYYYVGALACKLLGTGFLALRLVSFLSSLGCLLVIFVFVKKETGSAFPAVLSAGLLAATYRITAAWFDLARVDSLFLLLLLSSLLVLRFATGAGALFLSGLLISLSFLTKQSALLVAVAMAVYCLLVLPRRLKLVYPVTVAVVLGVSTYVLGRISEGWYSYFVFVLPGDHAIAPRQLTGFWMRDINSLSIAAAFSLAYVITLVAGRRKHLVFHACLLAGMIGASWLSRLHTGGYHNVLLPAYAAISIGFGLGMHAVLKGGGGIPSLKRIAFEVSVILIGAIQLLSLAYDPAALVPSEADRRAGDRFVEMLAGIEGEVFVPYHGFLPALAGKKTYAHTMAISDVLRAGDGELQEGFRQEIAGEILSGKYQAVVLDTEWGSMQGAIESEYRLRGKVFNRDDVFWPITGKKTRPELIYRPRR